MEYQRQVPLLDPGFQLDYDKLPRDENDLDPERIAYAREVQLKLVAYPEQVDQTPIEEWIAAQLERLGIARISPAPKPALEDEIMPRVVAHVESTIRHKSELPDSWQPVLDMYRSGMLSGIDNVWLTAPDIAWFLKIDVDVVRTAIGRIELGNRTSSLDSREGELIYPPSLLAVIRQQLSGVHLEEFKEEFQLNDQQLQKAREYLLKLEYPIFEGDICSPFAFQLLSDNILTFLQQPES